MHVRLGLLALASLALAGAGAVASAAPKKPTKSSQTTKSIPLPGTANVSKPAKPAAPSGPLAEQGDSTWVGGTVEFIQVDAVGAAVQLRLREGNTDRTINFSSACPAHQRLALAQHPALVSAWERGRPISIGIARTTGPVERYCTFAIALNR